jgi:hypothetical protein
MHDVDRRYLQLLYKDFISGFVWKTDKQEIGCMLFHGYEYQLGLGYWQTSMPSGIKIKKTLTMAPKTT